MGTRDDLDPAPSLSILAKGPKRFEGRKLGILVTDGADAALLSALKEALAQAGASFKIIAPKVGGAKMSDGNLLAADQMIAGAPSVLYDAVALLPSEKEMAAMTNDPAVRDFVSDAFTHCKFIGHVAAAKVLIDQACGSKAQDEGIILLSGPKDVPAFVKSLGELRIWSRERTRH